ncbi:MAG: hypothetical protein JSV45_00565 [Chromatiales bacterium]|nr:MAG: hypothetical protein JSV45_00565 [Chromatiales bacterium]
MLMVVGSGCSLLTPPPEPVEAPPPEIVADEPAIEMQPPAPAPPPPAPAPAPEVPLRKTAIVVSDSRPAYREVAAELEGLLDNYTTYDLADGTSTPAGLFATIGDSDVQAVVAIGLGAARQARQFSPVPVVFCQVFNVRGHELLTDDVRGVAATPPLALQLQAWKRLDPSLEDVGLIVGEGHDELLAEARDATREAQINLHVQVARSDRETMYLFDRMIADIDGFWLFPDNRVLSRPVLQHMFTKAAQRRVQMAVFNESLLDMGAVISSTTVAADVAATTEDILERLAKGDGKTIPAMTPLSDIAIRINDELAARYRSEARAVTDNSQVANSP